jgi:hypothetical protein
MTDAISFNLTYVTPINVFYWTFLMGYRDQHGIHPFMIYISKKCQTLKFWLSQQTSKPH